MDDPIAQRHGESGIGNPLTQAGILIERATARLAEDFQLSLHDGTNKHVVGVSSALVRLTGLIEALDKLRRGVGCVARDEIVVTALWVEATIGGRSEHVERGHAVHATQLGQRRAAGHHLRFNAGQIREHIIGMLRWLAQVRLEP
jgi:hypothetical protein